MADEEKQARVSGGFSGGSKDNASNPAKKLVNSISSALRADDADEGEAARRRADARRASPPRRKRAAGAPSRQGSAIS